MSTHLFIFNVLVIIGSFQGAVTSLLLWWSPKKSTDKLLLSGVLIVFVLLSCKILLHTLQVWETAYLGYLPLAFELAIQPLFYLYVLSLTRPTFQYKGKTFYHFIPAFLFLIHAVIVYASVAGSDNITWKSIVAESWHFNKVKKIEDYLAIVSACFYWYLSFREIRLYRQWLYTNIAVSSYPEYTWLRNILVIVGILIVGWGLNILLDYGFSFSKLYFFHWELFYLYMSGLIYYVGFKGYHQPVHLIHPLPLQPVAAVPTANTESTTTTDKEIKSNLKELIEKAMTEDKLYLDPDLSLAIFAQHLNTSPSALSSNINTLFGKNFRNFINEYRTEEVKKKLKGPDISHLSILGIALECGFNSEASFYRIFKNYTGLSPKEFMEKQP